MITKEKVRDALKIIAEYETQLLQDKVTKKSANQVGCKVRYSKFGKENEAKQNHNRKGVVVEWLEWYSATDGLVTVKWEGVSIPETMHISHVEPLSNQAT